MRYVDYFFERLERLGDFLERQPPWRAYVALFVAALVLGAATGHRSETTIDNAISVVMLLGISNTVKWINRRRIRRLTARMNDQDAAGRQPAAR
jgi:ABC-type antimicrobial peptide transport system permease subunit